MISQLKTNLTLPTALLLLALGIGFSGKAQTPPPPPTPDSLAPAVSLPMPPPPPPPADLSDRKARTLPAGLPDRLGQKRPGPPDDARPGELQPVTDFSGTVLRFTTNEDFVYDGFTLKTGTDSLHVHFAPDLGQKIQKSVKTGGQVMIKGVERMAPGGDKEIEIVSLRSNGTEIEMPSPGLPAEPVAPAFTKGTGKIAGLLTGPEGRVNALMLDNKRILRLPAAAFAGLPQPPSPGTSITYSGTVRMPDPRQWVQEDVKIIQVQTITVNGQQYLVGPR